MKTSTDATDGTIMEPSLNQQSEKNIIHIFWAYCGKTSLFKRALEILKHVLPGPIR